MRALKKYEEYLESVREQNQDEYQELSDILFRYETLKKSNESLKNSNDKLDKEVEDLKNKVNSYHTSKLSQIMTLNNDIATLQKEYEKLEDEKNKLKQEEEENSSKKMGKTSELALMLMAIDNLYNKCHNRQSLLKYPITADDPKNFDNFLARSNYSQIQLEFVSQYLMDFKKILAAVYTAREDIKNDILSKKRDNEII